MNIDLFAAFFFLSGTACVWIAFLLRRRRPWRPYPACGACGYSVRGLKKTICPECGADCHVVGLATKKPNANPLEGILVAIGVLLIGAGVIQMFVW